MARRVAWTNNSSGHSGTYVYRAPTLDPQNLPAPVATVDPVAQGETAEWVDSDVLDPGDYDYVVQDFDGQGVGQLSAIKPYTVAADLASAQVGDEIEGGIYGGTHTDGVDSWHVIFAVSAGEVNALPWGNYGVTTGATDPDDGIANQNLILSSFDNGDSAAFYHCRDYAGGGFSDWYMPARNELALIDALYNMSHPEFTTLPVNYRWSSTEDSGDNNKARMRTLTGTEFSSFKNSTGRFTRPVRRVLI